MVLRRRSSRRRHDDVPDPSVQVREFPVARGHVGDAFERGHYVAQVAVPAVPQLEPREDPGGLQVALDTGEVEGAAKVARSQARVCKAAVSRQPLPDRRLRKHVVAVAQQRNQVVGHRTDQRVLEVDNAETAVVAQQQIAAVIVAVHGDHRLRLRRVDQRLPGVVDEPGASPVAEIGPPATR